MFPVLNSLGELPGVPAEPGHLAAAVPGVSYWHGRRSCLSPAGVSLTKLYLIVGDVPLAALLTVPGQAAGLPHQQVEMLPNPPS